MRIAIALVLLSACADSDEARLDHPQILAVRTTPANAAPGEAVHVDILASDSTGAVYEADPVSLDASGLATEHREDGWFVTAGGPGITTLAVTLVIEDETWPATKKLVVADHADNPAIAMTIDGAAATEMVTPVGSTPELAALATGREPFTYAWFSSVGSVKRYHQQTAELDANEAGEGTVALIVRDSAGGVAWSLVPARIE